MSLFRGVTFFRDLSNNYEFAKLAINWGLLLIKATRQKKKKRILFLISIAVSYCWRSTKDLNHEGSRKWYLRTAAPAKSLQSCPTLCDPIDSSPPGSPNPGILQARTQEWVAISFSNAWKWKVKSESEVAQSYLTLREPMDCSPPGSSVHTYILFCRWCGTCRQSHTDL